MAFIGMEGCELSGETNLSHQPRDAKKDEHTANEIDEMVPPTQKERGHRGTVQRHEVWKCQRCVQHRPGSSQLGSIWLHCCGLGGVAPTALPATEMTHAVQVQTGS